MLLLSRFVIHGHSMEPTVKDQTTVLASSIPYLFSKPAVGDIVVYQTKNKTRLVKRIKTVKDEKYFLAGDNEKDSLDSRKFGWVERKDIVGEVIYMISAKRKNQRSKTSSKFKTFSF